MLHLESVTKLYGLVIGVNDISITLAPGAYGLLGPNGSGKTTLLNLITGQIPATLGNVKVLEQTPWNNAALFRRLGVCPTTGPRYPNVSGLEWVCYLTQLHGYRSAEAARRAEVALERLGMADAMRRDMHGYSRGMLQRTNLAQAIAHDPDLLILDEPFNGLDPIGRHEVTQFVQEWVTGGRSLLLASHILHEVEAITRSFLLISGGRLLASGSAEEVHSWLVDVPSELRMRGTGLDLLAERMLHEQVVETLRWEDEKRVLVFSTRTPSAVYRQLANWSGEIDCTIDELHSSDDSLESLFRALLRIHRGELR